MDAIDDLKKLTTFLENKDNSSSSDSESVASEEVLQDCARLEEEKNVERLHVSATNINTSEIWSGDEEEETRTVVRFCTDPTLKNALIYNVKKRRSLEKIYKKLELYLKELDQYIQKSKSKSNSLQDKRIALKSRLGIPYFKDQNGFQSPKNEDCVKMKENRQLLMSVNSTMTTWTSPDKIGLAKAVYKDVCQVKLIEIKKQITVLENLENAENNIKIAELKLQEDIFSNQTLILFVAKQWNLNTIDKMAAEERLAEIENEITKTREKISESDNRLAKQILMTNLKSLEYNKDNFQNMQLIIDIMSQRENIDWLKISTEILNCRHTDTECRSMWTCYMSPKFSKRPWTDLENDKLILSAKTNNFQNWDIISDELKIYKSAYQCCVHFHSKLCDKFNREKWSGEEDELLMETIAKCRCGKYISWSKVACYFKDRTKHQIYNRYKYSLHPNIKKGKFSISEDILLLVLNTLYANNFPKIKTYFPNRHIPQLRCRFKTIVSNNVMDWTIQEDIKIIEHVEKFGDKSWNKLATDRSQHCLRHRYNTLKKWFEENPTGKLEEVVRKKKMFAKRQKEQRLSIIESTVKNILQLEQNSGICSRQNLLTLDYIEELLTKIPNLKRAKNRKQIKKKFNDLSVDNLLKNFFKPSFKYVGRAKTNITDEVIEESSNTVEIILKLLNANIKLPSLDEIEYHPSLDDLDKFVLQQLISKSEPGENLASQSEPTVPTVQHVIPPSPETVVGFRGLMLHYSELIEHAKGKFNGYSLHIPDKVNKDKEVGLKYTKQELKKHDNNLDSDSKEIVLKERELFSDRFSQIFKWPCLMSESKSVPTDRQPKFDDEVQRDTTNLVTSESDQSEPETPVIKGRPPKKAKSYKIDLMNKARLLKKQMMIQTAILENGAGTSNSNNIDGANAVEIHSGNVQSEAKGKKRKRII